MRAPIAKEDELLDSDGGGAVIKFGAAVNLRVEGVELEPREVDELEALSLTDAGDREARGEEGFRDESMHFGDEDEEKT